MESRHPLEITNALIIFVLLYRLEFLGEKAAQDQSRFTTV
jgi:hypothetical protein